MDSSNNPTSPTFENMPRIYSPIRFIRLTHAHYSFLLERASSLRWINTSSNNRGFTEFISNLFVNMPGINPAIPPILMPSGPQRRVNIQPFEYNRFYEVAYSYGLPINCDPETIVSLTIANLAGGHLFFNDMDWPRRFPQFVEDNLNSLLPSHPPTTTPTPQPPGEAYFLSATAMHNLRIAASQSIYPRPSDYITYLASLPLYDTRPPEIRALDALQLTPNMWRTREHTTPMRLRLSTDTIRRLNAIATLYQITPSRQYSPRSIAAAVIEAIGLNWLSPEPPTPLADPPANDPTTQ